MRKREELTINMFRKARARYQRTSIGVERATDTRDRDRVSWNEECERVVGWHP